MFAPQTKPEIARNTEPRVTSALCPDMTLIVVEKTNRSEAIIVMNHFIACFDVSLSCIKIKKKHLAIYPSIYILLVSLLRPKLPRGMSQIFARMLRIVPY